MDELAAESGQELPPLPPIPFQQEPSNGIPRRSQREPGAWCREHGITPPAYSFASDIATAPVPRTPLQAHGGPRRPSSDRAASQALPGTVTDLEEVS